MNEIKRIHLGRQPFTISVDAHKLLRAYLEAIQVQVGGDEDVSKEIELRMAELLTERGITAEKVVLSEDVQFLKEQLGEPAAFRDEDETPDARAATPDDASAPKRLYRDTQNGMIAGVSSGLAAFFNVDAVIVRLLFVLAVVTGGWGIPIYIILWVIVPEAKTSSERLRMRGTPVTVDSLKQIASRVDVPGATRRASHSFGHIIEKLAHIFIACIGVGFLLFGMAALVASVVGAIYGVIYQDNIFVHGDFGISMRDWIFAGSLFVIAVLTSLASIVVGITLIRRTWNVPVWATAGAVAAFFVTFVVAAALAPGFGGKVSTYVDSLDKQKTIHQQPFSTLRIVSGEANFELPVQYEFIQSSTYSVTYKYMGKAPYKDIKTSVKNGVLLIDAHNYDNSADCSGLCIVDTYRMEVVIRAPQLSHLIIEGDSGIEIDDGLDQPSLSVEVGGNAYINLGETAIDNVQLTANEKRVIEAVFTGLSVDESIYPLVISGGHVYIPRTNQVALETSRNCTVDEHLTDALLTIDRMPERGVSVNSVLTQNAAELHRQQDVQGRTAFDCVLLGVN